jgi:Helix-turn-helix domain of resolvase
MSQYMRVHKSRILHREADSMESAISSVQKLGANVCFPPTAEMQTATVPRRHRGCSGQKRLGHPILAISMGVDPSDAEVSARRLASSKPGLLERSLIQERTQAGLAAAKRAGRTRGRPPKLTDDDIEAAKAMLANPDIGVTQITHRLGVSPATLYQYIPAARTGECPRRLRTALHARDRTPREVFWAIIWRQKCANRDMGGHLRLLSCTG